MTYPPLPGFGNQPASGNMLARAATDSPPSTILNRGLKIVEPVYDSNYTPPIHRLTHPSNPSPNSSTTVIITTCRHLFSITFQHPPRLPVSIAFYTHPVLSPHSSTTVILTTCHHLFSVTFQRPPPWSIAFYTHPVLSPLLLSNSPFAFNTSPSPLSLSTSSTPLFCP
ncbi:hypothetical protein BDZ91DRAFT_225569 [Kalaharituber pfeilii]|nr:hypothetical protein BDZ91DRAFT_225569 [Kalaharituber pfeilii]